MRKSLYSSIFAAMTALLALNAAAKVEMPKEGALDFNICFAGDTNNILHSDKHFAGTYKLTAAVYSNPPGTAFDRQAAVCVGIYAMDEGKASGRGYCEFVDFDGDKWFMSYQTDGSGEFNGSWETVSGAGTGKYQGMVGSGKYSSTGRIVPSALPGGFQRCNRDTGTYRLR